MALSHPNKDYYDLEDNGFCFLPAVFSKDISVSARHGLWSVINEEYETGRVPETRFWETGDDPKKIIKIDKPHLCNNAVWNLVTDVNFGKALAVATHAKKVQVWHSQVVWKPQSIETSGNAGWHRDAQYWPFWGKRGLFTAWVALSNVSLRSGPVRFISGSNHWKEIEGLDFFDKDLIKQDKILEKHHGKSEIVSGALKIGQVSIHSSMTYHSSQANLEERPRVGMVVHFCTDKAKRIAVKGDNKDYLDQLNDPTIAPIIYRD